MIRRISITVAAIVLTIIAGYITGTVVKAVGKQMPSMQTPTSKYNIPPSIQAEKQEMPNGISFIDGLNVYAVMIPDDWKIATTSASNMSFFPPETSSKSGRNAINIALVGNKISASTIKNATSSMQMLGSLPAERIDTIQNGATTAAVIQAPVGSNYIQISSKGSFDTVKDAFQNLQASFRLKDGLPHKNIQTWKTYTNNQPGFSIRYPESYKLEQRKSANMVYEIRIIGSDGYLTINWNTKPVKGICPDEKITISANAGLIPMCKTIYSNGTVQMHNDYESMMIFENDTFITIRTVQLNQNTKQQTILNILSTITFTTQ